MTPLRKKRIIERPPLTHDIVGVLHERDQSLVDLLVLKRALVHHRQHLQNQHDGNMCDIYDLTIFTHQQQLHALLEHARNLLAQLARSCHGVVQVLDEGRDGDLIDHDRCDTLQQRLDVGVERVGGDGIAQLVYDFFLLTRNNSVTQWRARKAFERQSRTTSPSASEHLQSGAVSFMTDLRITASVRSCALKRRITSCAFCESGRFSAVNTTICRNNSEFNTRK